MSASSPPSPGSGKASSSANSRDRGDTRDDTQGAADAESGRPLSELSPAERLARSRLRLRKALGPARGREKARERPRDKARASHAEPGSSRSADTPHRRAFHNDDPSADDETPRTGAFSTFLRLAERWWSTHPLRDAATIATQVAAPVGDALLAPVAKRHPWRLVMVAAGVGGAVVWARPWRWLPQAALSSVLMSAVWPRGSLSRWLASGGLIGLLTSSELRDWLADTLGGDDDEEPDAPSGATAPDA